MYNTYIILYTCWSNRGHWWGALGSWWLQAPRCNPALTMHEGQQTSIGIYNNFLIYKKLLGAIWIFSFWRKWNLVNGLFYLARNLTFSNFLRPHISLSQIHRTGNRNWYAMFLLCNIACSSTRLEIQNISISIAGLIIVYTNILLYITILV